MVCLKFLLVGSKLEFLVFDCNHHTREQSKTVHPVEIECVEHSKRLYLFYHPVAAHVVTTKLVPFFVH